MNDVNLPAHTPPNAPIRALFLDIDGTLIGGGSDWIAAPVRDAIAYARDCGVEIVLCTGRARFTTEPIATQIPPLGWAVTSNGGLVVHLQTGQVLHKTLLGVETALVVVRAILAAGVQPYVYEDSASSDVERSRVLYHPDLPVGPFADLPRFRAHAALADELPFTPISVAAFGTPDAMGGLRDNLEARLPSELAIIVSGSEAHWGVEVFAHGVSKRLGLQVLSAHLGVPQAQTMAIGDHMNDLEMLAWAGVGVAMGNAVPEAKQAADWTTATQTEHGAALAIRQMIQPTR